MNSPARHTNPNFPNRSIGPEQETGLRYSLAYELIGSTDRLINHPSGVSRVVTYMRGDAEKERHKEKLLDLKLILGNSVDSGRSDEQAFIIPRSARPLAYDSDSQVTGSYSYNDAKLFYDLGHTLSTVLKIDEIPRVIKSDIGHAVAIVEFTKPNERPLLLVPGVEHLLEPIGENNDPFVYYSEALEQEFGMRFRTWGIALRAGFERAEHELGE